MKNRIIDVLKKLKNKKIISEKKYEDLYPAGSSPGILCGRAKIHKPVKDGVPPFRPILSVIGTPTYKLSNFFAPLLTPLTLNEYTIKDSFSFAEELLNYDSNLVMASFDVESLFTNIPLQETNDLCVERFLNDKPNIDGFTITDFHELLTVTMSESLVLFDGTYYKQIYGVPIGSPLLPTFANSFLSYHEQIWLKNCPCEFKHVIYKRYVDDTFLLFRSKDHIGKFRCYLNCQHLNIKFTSEIGERNSISFLDIKIRRVSNRFSTSIYHKVTFSGVFTNFESFVPVSFKSNLIFIFYVLILNFFIKKYLILRIFLKEMVALVTLLKFVSKDF